MAERFISPEIPIALSVIGALSLARLTQKPTALSTSPALKEIVMNQAPQLEIVELGDAKEETKGLPNELLPEENPDAPTQKL